MAEENDLEKTEPATPRRLEQAREEGQIARSQELGAFVVLGAGGLTLWFLGGQLLSSLTGIVKSSLTLPAAAVFESDAMLRLLGQAGLGGFLAVAPVLGATFIAALAAPLLLNGWLFSLKPLQPKFSKLNPIAGFARIFSVQGLIELSKALLKVLVVGGIAAAVLWSGQEAMLSLAHEPTGAAIGHATRLIGWTTVLVIGGMVLVVAVDVPFQIWNHSRKLRMSREEVRRESKETDGDPQVKARIRSLQRDAARKRMMAEVPKADVVITNPTHFSVALSYRENSMRAPRVVAKGQDLTALRIRELAREHGVPVLEAPPLARALYRYADIGDEVPQTLYTAVAEVLAYVFQLRQYETVGGRAPLQPQAIAVPPELDPEEGERR